MNFSLSLEFERPILVNESEWKELGLGIFTLTFKKQTKELWHSVSKNTSLKIPVWWDVRDKYTSDMDEWSEMLERDEQEKERL